MPITISGGVQLNAGVVLTPGGSGGSGGSGGFQGSNFGYTSGGKAPPWTNVDTIDKFPFASDDNATDVGDLTVARSYIAGQQY